MPRAAHALTASTSRPGSPGAPRGVRQFGEVMLDELALSGFSLLGAPTEAAMRPLSCVHPGGRGIVGTGYRRRTPRTRAVAGEVVRPRRRIGRLAYERMTFEHDPGLPETLAADGLGGPARAVVHLCRHRDGPRPWLVWVHGAGQGGTEDLLLSRIGRIHHELGFNVAMPVQPGPRLPTSRMAGLPGHGPAGNVAGMMRRCRRCAPWCAGCDRRPTRLWCPGFRWAARWPRWFRTWSGSRRRCAVHADSGAQRDDRAAPGALGFVARRIPRAAAVPEVSRLTSVIDPLAVDPAPPPAARLIVGAWHDRMAMREPAQALQDRWGGQLYWYDGSHVGHLFSRRVQSASELGHFSTESRWDRDVGYRGGSLHRRRCDATVADPGTGRHRHRRRAEQIAEDSGFSSLLYRLHLTGDGVPSTCHRQAARPVRGARRHGDAGRLPARVVVLPTGRRAGTDRTRRRSTPRGWPTDSADFVLVLEDLQDWDNADHLAGLSMDRARLCIEQLAGLHAWSTDPANAAALSAFPSLDTPMARDLCLPAFAPGWQVYRDKSAVPVPPLSRAYRRAVRRARAEGAARR